MFKRDEFTRRRDTQRVSKFILIRIISINFGLIFSDEVFFLYRISFLWYSAIGFIITFLLGIIGSLITGPTDPSDVDKDLISPAIHDTLESLPIKLKKILNLPHRSSSIAKDINLKGVVNVTLNLNDEEPVKLTRAAVNNKSRKISSISVNF